MMSRQIQLSGPESNQQESCSENSDARNGEDMTFDLLNFGSL
jgi:hypothetical protein